jgi:hypothetical protein
LGEATVRLRDILYDLAQQGQAAHGTYWKDDIDELQEDMAHLSDISTEVARELGLFPEEVPRRIRDNGLEIEISH